MRKQDRAVLTLKNDLIFKAVYGNDTEESKFVLMALLNHILGREEDPIVSLEYKNPFHVRERVDEKESVLDIKVKTGSGELIDIEMQICSYEYLKNRLIYYHGGLIRGALNKGETYGKMLKTITICILDAVMFPETENFLNFFSLMEETTHMPFSAGMTGICVIELPKVNQQKRPLQELTPLEISLEYLKCADEIGSEELDELIRLGGKELEMTQFILEKTTEDEILQEKALAREKYLHDMAHFEYLQQEAKKLQQMLEKDNRKLKNRQQQLNASNTELREGNEELRESNEKLEADNEKLEADNEKLEADNEKLEADNEKLKKQLDELKTELQAMKKKQGL